MPRYFVGTTTKKDEGFMMLSTGCSGIDNESYVVTTNCIHSTDIPDAMSDAKTSALLIAGLLNAYYSGKDATKEVPEVIMRYGQPSTEESYVAPVGTPELPF